MRDRKHADTQTQSATFSAFCLFRFRSCCSSFLFIFLSPLLSQYSFFSQYRYFACSNFPNFNPTLLNIKNAHRTHKHASNPPSLPSLLHFLLIVEDRGLPWFGSLLLVGRTGGRGIRRVVEGELDEAWKRKREGRMEEVVSLSATRAIQPFFAFLKATQTLMGVRTQPAMKNGR